jgi:hypothetical protein
MRAAVIALIGFTCATPLAQAQHQDASVQLVEGLPSPTGTFSIGRRHFEWSDPVWAQFSVTAPFCAGVAYSLGALASKHQVLTKPFTFERHEETTPQ